MRNKDQLAHLQKMVLLKKECRRQNIRPPSDNTLWSFGTGRLTRMLDKLKTKGVESQGHIKTRWPGQ